MTMASGDIRNGGPKSEPYVPSMAKPVAIVGMACRLPAGASNLEDLWTTLANGQGGWTTHSGSRSVFSRYVHPNPAKRGCFESKGAHYLQDDIGYFDAHFFNVPATEATAMDPQQRHLLEVSYESLENAGIPMAEVAGKNVGVFIGCSNSDYRTYMHKDVENLPMFEATGNETSILSNRISYAFDLRGPSMTIDTACSSSLVALHNAFQSLQSGECSMAIVGGSHLNLMPETGVSLSTMRLLSPDGRSYAFDERATSGFGRGEGTSCIILKSLEAALQAGDPVRAIVRNTGINQDGRTSGLTRPNGKAQVALMRSVYSAVDLDPSGTEYIEAHGTGTAVGDPIEAHALGEVFGRNSNDPALTVGSLKSNIGHLEGASGVSSVVKTALMLERSFITPNYDFQQPNSQVSFKTWNIEVAAKYKPWDARGVRRASVNNFGFGGTNAHVILEEDTPSIRPILLDGHSLSDGSASHNGPSSEVDASLQQHVHVFSANDRGSLEKQIAKITAYLKERPTYLHRHLYRSLAYTLGQRRSTFPWRFAVSAPDPNTFILKMIDSALTITRSDNQARLGFVFTGQGSQWAKMGSELFHTYPAYALTINKADDALLALGAPWSLKMELEKPKEVTRIDEPYISQPACTALQIALVDLLRSWGIHAHSVIGHSSGEIAASYAAGVFDLETCIAIAYWRGIVSSHLRENSDDTGGGMLAVAASQKDTCTLIKACAAGRLGIACINSPSNVTVSGDNAAISQLQDFANEKSIWNRRLKVDVAYHSHHMSLVAGRYGSLIGNIVPKPRAVGHPKFFSSLKGGFMEPSSLEGSTYWVENLTSQVRFCEAMQALCELEKPDTLIEIGPHSTLQGPIREILQSLTGDFGKVRYHPCLVRSKDAITTMLDLGVHLYVKGCHLKMGAINFPDPHAKPPNILTDLPPYQWNHSTRYWHETRFEQEAKTRISLRHDLLGSRSAESNLIEPRWRNILIVDDVPWLRDHRVQGLTVFPMAGYLCMAIEAFKEMIGRKGLKLDGIVFREIAVHQALSVPDSTSVELQTCLAPHMNGPQSSSDKWYEFKILSWTKDRDWLEHCRGLLASETLAADISPLDSVEKTENRMRNSVQAREQLKRKCTLIADAAKIYRALAKAGFEYGPTFRHMNNVRIGPLMTLYNATIPDTASTMPYHHESEYTIHPITLDIFFQGVWPLIGNGGLSLDLPYMPIAIQEMKIATNITNTFGTTYQVFARMKEADTFARKLSVDIDINDVLDQSSAPAVTIKGLIGAPIDDYAVKEDDPRPKSLKTFWEPCISYLDQHQYAQLCPLCPPAPRVIESLWVLESLSLLYIVEALRQTKPEYVVIPHLKKLYLWMRKQVRLVQSGKNKHLGPNHLRMSQLDKKLLSESAMSVGSAGLLTRRIGENLSAILLGTVEPLAIMLEDNLLSRFYAEVDSLQRRYAIAATYIEKLAFQNPCLRLIEIGAGTAGTTIPILEKLGGDLSERPAIFAKYDFTDVTTGFFEAAKVKLASWGHLVDYRKLDIEKLPADQGFEPGSYDVVVASYVLHATAKMRRTLTNVRSLLKPGGKLVLIEETGCCGKYLRWLPFATLPGWWLDEHSVGNCNENLLAGKIGIESDSSLLGEPFREDGPMMTEEQWSLLISQSDFYGLDAAVRDYPQDPEQAASVLFATAKPMTSQFQSDKLDLIIVGETIPGGHFWEDLEAGLQSQSTSKIIWSSFSAVKHIDFSRKRCIILDNPNHPLLDEMKDTSFRGIQRLLHCDSVLWVGGARTSPSMGLVTGLCRAVRSENPKSNIVTLSIEDWITPRKKVADLIRKVFERSFTSRIHDTEFDTELAEIGGVVFVHRYSHELTIEEDLKRETCVDSKELSLFSQKGRALNLTISKPGVLDTLCFVDDERVTSDLHDDEIEIDIKASGLNFKDVILALGQLAGNHIGQECSGVVTRIGESVNAIRPGDRVCAIAESSIANFGRCRAACATPIPEWISFPEGASIPIIFCTAHYCLNHIARLAAGETVLIHAAAGGVGQAAIMLAQAQNAKILATVGSNGKKKFLMDTYHVPDECIFYSRDTSFAQQVLDITNGEGVDVALNSLAGEQLHATWECMAPFGKFVEIGKRDITSNMNLGMSPFERNVSFTAVDLTDLVRDRPQTLQRVLLEVMDLFRRRVVKAVSPIHEFSMSEVEAAFRSLQSGRLTGKLVIVPKAGEMVMAAQSSITPGILDPKASYLITGGTGGIGRSICRWMAQQGAKTIILASRSGSAQPSIKSLILEIASLGVRVEVQHCDVSKKTDVLALVAECSKTMPPIRGVIHGAFVDKDVLFEHATYSDWLSVTGPKVDGAWNLHEALSTHPLSFFILLSSVSGIIGNRGQAAYAASSAFLDAFAHYRASLSLPATALDLGLVTEVGWVAERPGMHSNLQALLGDGPSLTEKDVLALIKLAVTGQIDKCADHQIIVGLSLDNYHPGHPSAFWAADARFSHLRRHAATTAGALPSETTQNNAAPGSALQSACTLDEAVEVVTTSLFSKLSNVLVIPVEEISPTKPVVALGLDSLVAVEVRSWIAKKMEAGISTMELMTAGDVRSLAEMVVARSKLCERLRKDDAAGKEE